MDEPYPLAPVLRELMVEAEVTGELYDGRWYDIGTPERLEALNLSFQRRIKTIEYDGKL